MTMTYDFGALKGEPLAPSQLAFAVVDYEGGEGRSQGADESLAVPGAERLVLYLACLEAAAAGRLALERKLSYTAAHRAASRGGILRWLEPPKPLALKDALAQMMITGDDVGLALASEAVAESGQGVRDFLESFIGKVGLRSTSVEDVRTVDGLTTGVSMRSSAADLVGLIDALGACGAGERPKLGLAVDETLAGMALDVLASVSARDGLSGYLPSHGPFHTRSCHLLVDGGGGSAWRTANWTDVALVYRDGRRAFAAAVICKDVPGEIGALPGGYLARRTMALMGRRLWRKEAP